MAQTAAKGLRTAATMILVAPGATAAGTYRVLMQQRGAGAKFMPGALVYPGGVAEEADAKTTWLSFVHGKDAQEENGVLNKMAAMKIAAVRETFEESGYLLAQPLQNVKAIKAETMKQWRDLVHNDASKFVDLFQKYKLKLDLDKIYYWSNWITPVVEKRRFDTHFFLAVLPELPRGSRITEDKTEMVSSRWLTTDEIIDGYYNGDIKFLAPPQLHTIGELRRDFKSIKDIEAAGPTRHVPPYLPWVPVTEEEFEKVAEKDFKGTILPGDEEYPLGPQVALPGARHRVQFRFADMAFRAKVELNDKGRESIKLLEHRSKL
eukprot:Clim_evm225s157 gene=Clim_evmTU225s157